MYLANGPHNILNGVNFNDPEYNALLEKTMRMLDSPERKRLTGPRRSRWWPRYVPWIQVAWFEWSVATRKTIDGFVWTPDNQLRFAPLKPSE